MMLTGFDHYGGPCFCPFWAQRRTWDEKVTKCQGTFQFLST